MEHSAEQLEGAIEVGGRVTVNRDEELVADWLRTQGHAVRHLTNGDDPPDLVVDENIAVEVTTIMSFAHRSTWDFMERVCKSLGPAEGGRGYWIEVTSDDKELLQGGPNRSKIKSDLGSAAKTALRLHYASADTASGSARLPHGVEIRVVALINNNRWNVKYKVGFGGSTTGRILVPWLIATIQAAVTRKTNNRTIQQRIGQYEEWWLAVTDPLDMRRLNDNEMEAVTREIECHTPWRRILLVSIVDEGVGHVHYVNGSKY